MQQLMKQGFSFGLLIVLMAGAALFFGADTPMAVYFFSGLILLVAAGGLLSGSTAGLPPSLPLIGIVLALSLAMDWMHGHLADALPAYAGLMAAGGVFLTARKASLQSASINALWTILMLAFLAFSIWAFVDFIVNPDSIHGRPRPYHMGRLSGSFLSANTAATFFGVGLLVAGVGLLQALGRVASTHLIDLVEGLFRHGAVSLVTFLFCAICLVLTASRAGIAFAAICLLILFGWQTMAPRKRDAHADTLPAGGHLAGSSTSWLVYGALVVLAIIAVGFWSVSGELAAERYSEIGSASDDRLVMYRAYWQAILANPWFGGGFGAFEDINNLAMTADNAHILSGQGAAHNMILQWLMQKGLIGSLPMWGTIGLILWRLWQGLPTRRRYRTHLRGVLIISLFVILHGQVDYAIEIPGFMWWWALILGLGAGIAAGRNPPAASGRH